MRVIFHCDGADATAEQIQKVMNLYQRPGTPGEKAAAAAALRRMGVEPQEVRPIVSETPRPRFTSGPKRFEVTIDIEGFGSQEFLVEASDQIDAEYKAREEFKKTWKRTGGGKFPKFSTRAAKRVF